MQIHSQTQQALTRLDQDRNGLTVGELRQVDQDQDGQLSEAEAQEVGIASADLPKINQFLSQNADLDPTEVVFSTAAMAGGRDSKTFDATWRQHRDAGNDALTVTNTSQLSTRLGLSADFADAPKLKALLDILHAQGRDSAQVLTYLERIGSRHGKATLESISNSLTNYYNNGAAVNGVSKNVILTDALHDIAYPSDIDQSNRNTCGAAAIQMKLAIERPLQYVNTLVTLAQNRNVSTPGGATMSPNNTWVNDASDGRSLSSRIMENAIMNLAGQGTFYDDTYNSGNDAEEGGLSWGEQTYALEEIFNNDDYEDDSTFTSASSLYQYAEDEIARGRPVTVSFDGHAVLMVGIDKSQNPPRVIMNSWGAQYEMTVDEFKSHVKSVRSVDDSGSDNRQTAAGSRVILGDR